MTIFPSLFSIKLHSTNTYFLLLLLGSSNVTTEISPLMTRIHDFFFLYILSLCVLSSQDALIIFIITHYD